MALSLTLCPTTCTVLCSLSLAALFVHRSLDFFLVAWFDFFLFLLDQPQHFRVQLLPTLFPIGSTVSIVVETRAKSPDRTNW